MNPVTIPLSEKRVMVSRKSNRNYQLFIAKPSVEPPPTGYPVIYVLDANAVFATVAEALRVQGRRPEKTGVVPAVVVGIGCDTEAPFDSARVYDFTMPTPLDKLPVKPDGKPWPDHGGANSFLKFIVEEVKPEIHRQFPIDQGKQTLFGHSLGGLFVLYFLFTHPHEFQRYVAGSPSIHWNKEALCAKEEEFQSRLQHERVNTEVLIGVGELEKYHPCGMNRNAKEFAQRLSLFAKGVEAEFVEFAGESHLSVLLPLINRAIRSELRGNSL